MENKNLIFRYFLYFILSFALSIFVINWFKNISLEAVLNDYKKESLNKYNRYYDELIKQVILYTLMDLSKTKN